MRSDKNNIQKVIWNILILRNRQQRFVIEVTKMCCNYARLCLQNWKMRFVRNQYQIYFHY